MIINHYTMDAPTPAPLPITPIEKIDDKDVIFFDYDGTVVAAYTAEEFAELSALPANPSHTGLIAQGWNITRARIESQLNICQEVPLCVGQMYTTSSGATEIDIDLDDYRKSPYLSVCVNGTVTIDWGDNSTDDTITASDITVQQTIQHLYTSGGLYTISITCNSGSYTFGIASGTQYEPLLYEPVTNEDNQVYKALTNKVIHIRLGNGLTYLNGYSFSTCYGLLSITMTNAITTIGDHSFHECRSLQYITIPNSCTNIGAAAFINCNNLCYISIPQNNSPRQINGLNISESAFAACSSLKSLYLPNGMSDVNYALCQYCNSLEKVYIPYATNIEDRAFEDCHALNNVFLLCNVDIGDEGNIHGGLQRICQYAFSKCYSLRSFKIPDTVTRIDAYVFQYCNSLESIEIPSRVSTSGSCIFYNCSALQSVTIKCNDALNTDIFRRCASLQHVTFQNATRWNILRDGMFSECYLLTNITIPSSVTSFGSAFTYCYSLTSITIPSAVASVSAGCFQGCSSIKAIHLQPTSPPTMHGALFGNRVPPQDLVIYVPYSADHSILNAYKEATNWATFASQMQEEPQE